MHGIGGDEGRIKVELRVVLQDLKKIWKDLDDADNIIAGERPWSLDAAIQILGSLRGKLEEARRKVSDASRHGARVVGYAADMENRLKQLGSLAPDNEHIPGMEVEAAEVDNKTAINRGLNFVYMLKLMKAHIEKIEEFLALAENEIRRAPESSVKQVISVYYPKLGEYVRKVKGELGKEMRALAFLFGIEHKEETEISQAAQAAQQLESHQHSKQVEIYIESNIWALRELGLTAQPLGRLPVYNRGRYKYALPDPERWFNCKLGEPGPVLVMHGALFNPKDIFTHYVILQVAAGGDSAKTPRLAGMTIWIIMTELVYSELERSGFRMLNQIIESNLPAKWVEFLKSQPVNYGEGGTQNPLSVFDCPRRYSKYDQTPPEPPQHLQLQREMPKKKKRFGLF